MDKNQISRRQLISLLSSGTVVGFAGCNGISGDNEETSSPDDSTDPTGNEGKSTTENELTSSSEETTTAGNDSTTTESDSTELVEVTEGESIQAAIDEVDAGGRVEIGDGVFEESVTVNKKVTIVGGDRTVLDGIDTSGIAFTIEEDDVEIRGMEISRFAEGAIATPELLGAVSVSEISINEVDSENALDLSAESIELSDLTIEDCSGAALSANSSRSGSVVMDNVNPRRCSRGILVSGAENVTIQNTESLQNRVGIWVEPDTTRSQSVEITDSELIESGTGLEVTDLGQDDEVTIQNVDVVDSGAEGIKVSGADVTVDNISATGNAENSLDISSTSEGTVTVSNSTIEQTTEGNGLKIIDGKSITVDSVGINQSRSDNLLLRTEAVRGQSVEIRDSTTQNSSGGSGIHIDGTSGEDTVSINGTNIYDNEDEGVYVNADNVTIDGVEVANNGSATAGIDVTSSSNGEVTIRNTTVDESSRDRYSTADVDGHGLYITDGNYITVENVDLFQNEGSNLLIESETARGQSVTVSNTTAEGKQSDFDFSGISIEGTSGDDIVTLESVSSVSHRGYGFRIGGEDVTMRSCSASDNGEGPINLLDIDREDATIVDSDV